jgi:hypothetical protein
MFFLRNRVIIPMLKNKRVFSNCNNNNNNNCCNFDTETKQKIQLLFVMSPTLYALTLGSWVINIVTILVK